MSCCGAAVGGMRAPHMCSNLRLGCGAACERLRKGLRVPRWVWPAHTSDARTRVWVAAAPAHTTIVSVSYGVHATLALGAGLGRMARELTGPWLLSWPKALRR